MTSNHQRFNASPLDHPENDLADPGMDLDDLLSESLTIAAARKTARSTPKGTDPDAEALAAQADAALTWAPSHSIAHFIIEECGCGAAHRRFNAWYILSSHRWLPGVHRLLRSESDHQGLPTFQYTTRTATTYCADCLADDDLPIFADRLECLEALGENDDLTDSRQLELNLWPAPIVEDLEEEAA